MYDEEEISRWEREGGKFLLENGVIDSDSLEEIEAYKRGHEEEEIEKIEGRRSFDIVKLNERSDKKMSYYEYADSANNDDNEELENLVADFLDEEVDEDLKKQLKVIPEKLREALGSAYKILIEYKDEMKDIPELLEAVKLMARLATEKPGEYPSPGKYPYPGKIKKSDQPILWSDMLEQMFPDDDDDDEDFEKSDEAPTKETPWPSFKKEFKKNARKIKKAQDKLEELTFDPYDRAV